MFPHYLIFLSSYLLIYSDTEVLPMFLNLRTHIDPKRLLEVTCRLKKIVRWYIEKKVDIFPKLSIESYVMSCVSSNRESF